MPYQSPPPYWASLPKAPTCGHRLYTLVDTDFSTWPATEVYACDTCGAKHAQPWE